MQDQVIINFQEARDFSHNMNATYTFIRQNFKRLGKSLLFFAAPFVLLSSVLFSDLIAEFFNISKASSSYGYGSFSPVDVEDYFGTVNFFIQLFAALIFMVVGGVFTVSTIYGYMLVYHEKQTVHVEMADVWKAARQLFWRNFFNMFLYCMGMMLSMGLLLIPIMVLIAVFSFVHFTLAVIAYFLYYILLLSLCIYFSMVFFISCTEKINFFSALGRLFWLTKKKFWNTVLIGGINIYIQYVFAIVFLIPWYIYLFLDQWHNVSSYEFLSGPSAMTETVGTILFMIYNLVSILLVSFPLIALAFQYYNLVERRESRGLIARIESFGVHHSTDHLHEDF